MIAGVGEALLPVLTPTKSANPANEVAKRLTGRDYISWSALSTFRTCPLKYKFRYVDGLPEESVSSALVFGTGIHTAVEQHFQAILSGDPKPNLDALLFAYRSAWLPHDPEAIQFGTTETRASLDALAPRRAFRGGCWASRRRSGACWSKACRICTGGSICSRKTRTRWW